MSSCDLIFKVKTRQNKNGNILILFQSKLNIQSCRWVKYLLYTKAKMMSR